MAASMLNCNICPKQPTFSDTSHLLTHVSSKRHLSNLHKLQVRSYQEISAGHQLAAYNQWYQEHDLGHLLSERMIQKEFTQATKRRRATTSTRKIKKDYAKDAEIVASESRSFAIDPRLQQTPSTRPPGTPKVIAGTILQPGDESDSVSSPIKQQIKCKARRSLPGLIKRSPSDTTFELAYPNPSADIGAAILDAPKTSKPKGVLWPGMHLFDAATAEMRRKRNQKKDGSALMQMEKTSKNVYPTEVIYSEEWTAIKQRPITGMVEDSSPLKGESPLPKKTVRRKRQVLAEISANIPRNAKRSVKLEQPQATRRRDGVSDVTNNTSPSLPSSSSSTSYAARSRFSPTEDETMEFKLKVEDLVSGEKGGNFTIFHDKENPNHRHHHLLNTTAEQRATTYPHFANSQMQSHLSQARPQIPFTTPSWHLPQYQQLRPYQNLYMTQASGNKGYYVHKPLTSGTEDFEPWLARTSQVEQSGNHLGWNHNAVLVQNPYQVHNNSGQIGFLGLPSQDDMFGYSANPLSAAYQNLQDHPESPFKTSETADLLVKPERTEHDYN